MFSKLFKKENYILALDGIVLAKEIRSYALDNSENGPTFMLIQRHNSRFNEAWVNDTPDAIRQHIGYAKELGMWEMLERDPWISERPALIKLAKLLKFGVATRSDWLEYAEESKEYGVNEGLKQEEMRERILRNEI